MVTVMVISQTVTMTKQYKNFNRLHKIIDTYEKEIEIGLDQALKEYMELNPYIDTLELYLEHEYDDDGYSWYLRGGVTLKEDAPEKDQNGNDIHEDYYYEEVIYELLPSGSFIASVLGDDWSAEYTND